MKLYKQQEEIIEKARPILEKSGVVLITAEMRLGKSIAALMLASETKGKVLFVTKAKAIDSVVSDIAQVRASDVSLDVDVVSYDSLHKVETGAFSCVIADECHRYSSFPKPSKRAKQLQGIFQRSGAKAILLSGTPTVESICQAFQMFQVTGRGPWTNYTGLANGFYAWFREYGIPEKIRIAGGREINSYKKGQYEKIIKSIAPLTVTYTQEQAGFKQKAQVHKHMIENDYLANTIQSFKRDNVLKVDDHYVYASGVAPMLQKCHMMAGGTVIDDEEEAFVLPPKYDPEYRARYIRSNFRDGKQYAIFTAYIHERELIKSLLDCTEDMEAFKRGEARFFVGSMVSWAEGVDLSWLDGGLILYSVVWSGATYLQILDRMNNMKREDPINVHVLMLKRGIDEMVFKAVGSKQNFNSRFYKDCL